MTAIACSRCRSSSLPRASWRTEVLVYGGYDIDGNQQLAFVSLDGTAPMRIFVFPAGMHDPVLSPDGKHSPC